MTTVKPKPRALDWFELAHAGLHPIQVLLLEALAEGGNVPLSTSALAKVPRVRVAVAGAAKPLGTVSYHVQQLLALQLLEFDHEAMSGNFLQKWYVLSDRAILSPRQAARRALERSASKMAGAPEPLTGETLGQAFQTVLCGQGESSMTWDELPDDHRVRLARAFGELLEGVAGA